MLSIDKVGGIPQPALQVEVHLNVNQTANFDGQIFVRNHTGNHIIAYQPAGGSDGREPTTTVTVGLEGRKSSSILYNDEIEPNAVIIFNAILRDGHIELEKE